MRALGRLLRFLFVCATLALTPSAATPSATVTDAIAWFAPVAAIARAEAPASPKAQVRRAAPRRAIAITSADRAANERAFAAAHASRPDGALALALRSELYLAHCALLC